MAAMLMPAMAADWMTDFEEAKACAAREGKVVLADFTGSDWCHFCNVLRRRVLDTPAFAEYGEDKFIYLEIDLPRRKQIPQELMQQNNALVQQYRVGGFPTVILIDAQGHALGGFTGGMTRMADVQKSLQPALEVHRHMQAAASAAPEQRIEHLAAAYRVYPDNYRSHNAWLRELLEAEDPADSSGWRSVYAAELQMQQMDEELRSRVSDRAAIIACFDRYIAQALPGNKPRMLRQKDRYLCGVSSIRLRTAKTVEHVLEARDLQLQAADCAETPEEQAERRRRVLEVFKNPESLLPGRGTY